MRQPSFSRRAALATGLSVGAASAVSPALSASRRQPNILYIMADDLGYADVSCYGRTEYRTPAIDGLAAQGMRFTHAYANSAVCTATRVALITGRYQYRLQVGLQEPLENNPAIGLPPEEPTVASLLRKQGYRTTLIGKWHMGGLPRFGPLKSGYDEFYGIRQGGADYFRHGFNDRLDLWDDDTLVHDPGYLTEMLGKRAIETLERRAEGHQPFFISLHFNAPHWPWEAPGEEGQKESDRITASKDPLAFMDHDGGDLATYAAMVTAMDAQIGKVLAALKRLKLNRDTIVVFTSDNGGERFSNTWPFTGKKTELLEGGLRIPAIVRWPGIVKPGTTSDAQIMSMDWLPTFLATSGAGPYPTRPSDGIDIRPALEGRPLAERTLYWRFKNMDQKAARRGQYKYLAIAGNEFLFDVVADPLERANLKERVPQVFSALKNAWSDWNKGMLFDPQARSYGFSAKDLADHFGADN